MTAETVNTGIAVNTTTVQRAMTTLKTFAPRFLDNLKNTPFGDLFKNGQSLKRDMTQEESIADINASIKSCLDQLESAHLNPSRTDPSYSSAG